MKELEDFILNALEGKVKNDPLPNGAVILPGGEGRIDLGLPTLQYYDYVNEKGEKLIGNRIVNKPAFTLVPTDFY